MAINLDFAGDAATGRWRRALCISDTERPNRELLDINSFHG